MIFLKTFLHKYRSKQIHRPWLLAIRLKFLWAAFHSRGFFGKQILPRLKEQRPISAMRRKSRRISAMQRHLSRRINHDRSRQIACGFRHATVRQISSSGKRKTWPPISQLRKCARQRTWLLISDNLTGRWLKVWSAKMLLWNTLLLLQ